MKVIALQWMLFIMSLLSACVSAYGLIRLNLGVQVPRGQSVFVTDRELQLGISGNFEPCKVEVVHNEPLTQRVGKLTPQVFDCQFLPDEVQYVHNGSPLLEEDAVLLRVYRFTDSETFIETLVLTVKVMESSSKLVQFGNTSLLVQEFYNLSNALDSSVLTFQTQTEVVCTVRLLTSDTNMPALGQLVMEDPAQADQLPGPRKGRQAGFTCPGNKACLLGTREVQHLKTTCNEFLTAGLKYQHLRPSSPETDYIPIRVELRDKSSRALLEAESIWLPVKILGAMPNHPPKAGDMSTFILEIDQFILTPMTTTALDATDHETPQARLVFNVTKPPPEGYITHLEDHTKSVSSFTGQDLHEMNIAFQPPNSSFSGRRKYEVEFQAIDDSYATSPTITVHFYIRTAETKAPRVSWNMGLDLLEGQSRPITWENLQIVDNDNIKAVTLVAVDGPLHGRLSVRGGKGFMFKVQDLRDGVVVYHHSDTDTTRDHIVFRITDGRHSIRHKFPINILPKDDTPPFLINNVAFEVQEGGSVSVQEYMLLASDLDSSDDYILYQLITQPRAGELVKKASAHDVGVPVSSFFQRDLTQGLIFYAHSGEEVFDDTFDFTLSDSHQPPNLSEQHTVVVHVFPVKDQLPNEVSGTVRSVTVKETEVVCITQSHLHFRDPEHKDTDVAYFITQPCFSPTNPGMQDAGRLFYTDSTNSMKKDAMVPVLKSFTQNAVNHHKVGYMPPNEDIGLEPLFVQFIFSVTDQHGGTIGGIVFNITVTPVDNQSPEMFANLMRVEEGGAVFLTEEHLLVRDADTPLDRLRVHVNTLPRHGRLELRGVTLQEGGAFPLLDLRALHIRYIHDDSETVKDSISFTVTDGINSVQGDLLVQIFPVNDEPPQLGSGLCPGLSCAEGGHVKVTVECIFATDADSDDAQLRYMLARTPAHGELQRGGVTMDKFSQKDLVGGLIYYQHTGGEIGLNPVWDSVTLIVSDGEAGGTDACCQSDFMPPPVPLHGSLPVYDLNITVLPVNDKPPSVTIGSIFAVDEGTSACLCGGFLGALDLDTNPEDLAFHIETPPQHGFLENTLPSPGFEKSNAGVRVDTFSQLHLSSGFINYVQSEHVGAEPKGDHFLVSVSDGVHRSTPVPFYIIINPTNDEPPSLTLNNFTVKEGGIRDLSPEILYAVDLDSHPDALTLTVMLPPAHGALLSSSYSLEIGHHKDVGHEVQHRSQPVHSFTLQQLKEGMKVVYMHDDTETLQDSFSMQLTDGKHTVQGTAWVCILPVNDEKPRLLKNAGVEVEAMSRRVISSVVLNVEDLDTPSHEIYYILNVIPKFGLLQLKTEVGWTELVAGMNFTQEDVEMNRLWYAHTSLSDFKGYDRFVFYLSDVDNNSPPQTFYISVHTTQKGDIVLVTKTVTLMEGERVVLTTDHLMATDNGSASEELLYTVVDQPRHGHLHEVQHPGVTLTTFSQMDIAAHRVCYTHDNSRSEDQDSFSFVITSGLTSKSGSLQFVVESSDRIPPTLKINTGLQLSEGAVKIITPENLELSDPDTALENLTYTLTQMPQHGWLLLRGFPVPHSRFTQANIHSMELAYHHQGGPVRIDRFSFLPSDGTNTGYLAHGQLQNEPSIFTIQVEHLDKMPPGLVTKTIPSRLESLQNGLQVIYITSRELQASDPDSPDQELEFTIVRPPHFGYLENVLTGGYIKGRFTQKDLDQKAVRFIIPADVEVTADSFEFRVTDPAGNTMLPEMMELRWSRVELSTTCYRVCENSGTLSIQVTRNGNSIDPAYVTIQVEDGTAKVGKDFTHSTATLIQFDPGVNIKTWNIYLNDDGLEENHEKFEVVLEAQRNAVLGPKNRATIEIVDPRGGKCDPDDLSLKENEEHRPSAHTPHPAPDKEPDPDSQTEILWESHPPRGDVPGRRHFLDYSVGEPQDQAYQSQERRPFQVLGTNSHRVHLSEGKWSSDERVWKVHEVFPLRILEETVINSEPVPGAHPALEITPIWTWPGNSLSGIRTEEVPQGDSPPPGSDHASLQHESVEAASLACPADWIYYRKNCYILGPGLASWSSAQHACSLLFNSHLTSIHSRTDMRRLWRLAGKQPFWIGLTGAPGQWSWTNSRQLSFSRLEKSRGSQPAIDVCVLAETQKRWTQKSCTTGIEYRYICSTPAQNI
ncbi:FRAS1-related extracellular matrix protein 1b [Denticeps clupeoides]|uniref:FRAS1-related extracellular matrix protein 1b n=1 Tax=Denticeps clupeoides TaxID=299321 RepID=UPI0010A3BC0B|nr:FRAS1-related extracellular matrix protein 1-like [Denticeps clupeoides]